MFIKNESTTLSEVVQKLHAWENLRYVLTNHFKEIEELILECKNEVMNSDKIYGYADIDTLEKEL